MPFFTICSSRVDGHRYSVKKCQRNECDLRCYEATAARSDRCRRVQHREAAVGCGGMRGLAAGTTAHAARPLCSATPVFCTWARAASEVQGSSPSRPAVMKVSSQAESLPK